MESLTRRVRVRKGNARGKNKTVATLCFHFYFQLLYLLPNHMHMPCTCHSMHMPFHAHVSPTCIHKGVVEPQRPMPPVNVEVLHQKP